MMARVRSEMGSADPDAVVAPFVFEREFRQKQAHQDRRL
jgi:hypothetical protein